MEAVVSLNQIGLYNPQRQSDEVTRQLFVVRQKQFELILNQIVQEKGNSIPQHYLIIGQRGMGKSMMLKRIEVELRNEYYQQFIPLLFPEEQNNIKSLSEFWQNNLMVLIKSLKSENIPNDKLTEIIKKKDEISKKSPEKIADEAYKYLMDICHKLRRRPVLLIDNIGLVFNRLDSNNKNKLEQWSLRKILSENGAPIVVGAGITITDDVVKYDMPFYDFFQVQYLRRLSYDEFEELLENLSKVTNSDEVTFTSIQTNGPRQRSLFDLTGGSPRTTVMLFKQILRGYSQDIIDDLEILADEATPLYKAKFEEMPQQQQIIIDAIAMNWDAISLSKLSKTTHYASNQLSPQLKRLTDEGWIETTPVDKKSRKAKNETEGLIKGNAYFISERFFNIWYLLRYDILKEGVYCLLKFLECFYRKEELERMSDDLLEHDIDSTRQLQLASKSENELNDQNFGLAKDYLMQAFKVLLEEDKIQSITNEQRWMKFGGVVIGLGHGSWLLSIFEEKGYDVVLSPYYTAIQALEIEKQYCEKDAEIYLKSRAREISDPARKIIDRIRKWV